MFKALSHFQTKDTVELSDYLNQFGNNIFNPSVAELNDTIYISFRLVDLTNMNRISAKLLIINKTKDSSDIFDLDSIASTHGVAKVSDPKLATIDGNIWITFNTGWQPEGNDIYLWKVTPDLGRPQICTYQNRQKIEKNWGFFSFENQLLALYSLKDGVFLKADIQNNEIVFNEFKIKSILKNKLGKYTIGTQPISYNNKYYIVAHRKFNFRGKRLYLGRILCFNFENGNCTFSLSKDYIFHSYSSLLGSKLKLNKNLISCSYFSGLTLKNNSFILSYGINDIDFNFSQLLVKDLWH